MLSYVGETDHVKQKQANSYSSDMFSVKRSVYFPRITAPWRKLQHKLPLFKPEGSGFFYIIDVTRHFFLTLSCIYWQFPVPYAGKLFTCQVKICKNSFLCFVFRQKALLSLLWPCSLGAPWTGAGKNSWQNGMAECLKVFERTQAPGRKGERPMPPGRRNRPQRNGATHTRSRRPGGCRHSCSGTLPPLQQCLFPVNPLESDFKGLHPEQIRDHAPGHKPDLWTRA